MNFNKLKKLCVWRNVFEECVRRYPLTTSLLLINMNSYQRHTFRFCLKFKKHHKKKRIKQKR